MLPRFLAYYLPQYYPIPENDKWWGKGFTEWTNVAKARPLFKGHYQPRFPSDLGYYDLRVPEVREQQAELARMYGVDGFVYYHYWFGNGKMLLEKPLQEVIGLQKPDFPFCVCWTNESWKGVWFGDFQNKLLIEQTYPGKKDYLAHFDYLRPIFSDDRYIRVDGKLLFNVYMPVNIPDIGLFVDTFREAAYKAGLGELYLLASRAPEDWNPTVHGFDGVIGSEFVNLRFATTPFYQSANIFQYFYKKLSWKLGYNLNLDFDKRNKPLVVEYEEAMKYLLPQKVFSYDYFPCTIHDWDNTPRSGNKGLVLKNSTPELWEKHLQQAFDFTKKNNPDRPLIFIKSWNEWAEGNYLEPDQRWGHRYLEVIKQIKQEFAVKIL